MALMRICRYRGCGRLVSYDDTYCEMHKAIATKERRQAYLEYDKRRRFEGSYSQLCKELYDSCEWKQVREIAMLQTMYIDVVEYYRTGQIVLGDKVHHIVPLDKAWDKRLDIDNLIGISERSHRVVHAQYDKGQREYESCVKMLVELRDKFRCEFGLV